MSQVTRKYESQGELSTLIYISPERVEMDAAMEGMFKQQVQDLVGVCLKSMETHPNIVAGHTPAEKAQRLFDYLVSYLFCNYLEKDQKYSEAFKKLEGRLGSGFKEENDRYNRERVVMVHSSFFAAAVGQVLDIKGEEVVFYANHKASLICMEQLRESTAEISN
jgi:hypothetical protein